MENTNVQPEQTVAQPELTITDLMNIRSIIEAAVRRGAFGAKEISSVGVAFDKLDNFLNSVQPPKQENTEATGQ